MAGNNDDDAAVRAFEDVRGEVSLLRRAVDRLTAERNESSESVDYSETLGVLSKTVTVIAQRVDGLVKSPALSLTPEMLASKIIASASTARRDDQQMFGKSRASLDQAARQLSGILVSARAGDAQNRWLIWSGLGGTVLGILLWVACAGPLAHLVPESWHWPERMAARTLRLPMRDSGQRSMASASPSSRTRMVANEHLGEANEAALAVCRHAVERSGKPSKCVIEIAPDAAAPAPHGRQS